MIAAIVGGQFGSEGKGLIAGLIAQDYPIHVRVGAANAGHTLYTDTGIDPLNPKGLLHGMEKHVMQQLPCAAYANPSAALVIGPGALISPEIFAAELELNRRWRVDRGLAPAKVYVDGRAHVITQEQIVREAASDLQERIGSTSATAREGIGTAQADRVMRQAWCVRFGSEQGVGALAKHYSDELKASELPVVLSTDTSGYLRNAVRARTPVLLEGTQGTGLSLTTGDFPYVTSRNTTATGLAADAGVPGSRLKRVILVCRTFPIRVAGNSGPFHRGSQETAWEAIDVDGETERTTVTKKIRRVATFSMDQILEAVWLNGATEIALTFADYLEPKIKGGAGNWSMADLGHFPAVKRLAKSIHDHTGVRVTFIGTGPHSVIRLGGDHR